MSDWEIDIKKTTVCRQGDDQHISTITVNTERSRRRSGGRVCLNFEYRVAEDKCASLHHVERGNYDSTERVHTHHLIALLPAVERAVTAVPGVEWTESLEDTISSRRRDDSEEQ
jgi:hypothetical protein